MFLIHHPRLYSLFINPMINKLIIIEQRRHKLNYL
jgi:hypothetical protein